MLKINDLAHQPHPLVEVLTRIWCYSDHMRTVGTLEAKTHLSQLLDAVEGGEEVIITRHGKPVARMHAVDREQEDRAARWRAAMLEVKEGQSSFLRPGETWKDYTHGGHKY